MNQITQEITDKFRKELEPIAVEMAKSGSNSRDISAFIQKQMQRKIRDFYYSEELDKLSTRRIMVDVFRDVEGCSTEEDADSKAEKIFYRILKKNDIPFDFQVKIGPYKVDYLINGSLVFEGEGPCHIGREDYDKRRENYLKRMGYDVLRMRWNTISLSPEAVIEGIKDRIGSSGK
jgi:very-short-patch-repair endonuclease